MTSDRQPEDVAREIRDLLEDDPMWVDFEGHDDRLVSFLLGETRPETEVPRELLWEYTASRWTELYPTGEDDELDLEDEE